MADDNQQPSNPQPDIPAEPHPSPEAAEGTAAESSSLNGTSEANSPSETPASPEVSSDAETSEMPSNLEAQQEPISEPTEPFADAQGKLVLGEAPFDASQGKLSPAQSPSVIGQLLAKARAAIFSRKQKKLEKILNLALRQKAQGKLITNNDVEKLLRVSDKTAERYLGELVRQGKLRKTGSTSQTQYEITI